VAEVYYLDLGDFCLIAAEVLGRKVARLPRIGLATSALAVPSSGFGGHRGHRLRSLLSDRHLAGNGEISGR
jgi:hypothetical protein